MAALPLPLYQQWYLDNTFGTNGVATLGRMSNFTLVFGDLAIQSDGKIVVVGTQQTGGLTTLL
jgi:hypothetical protein